MQSRRILLVTGDLMASSRLAGVVRGGGGTLEVQATPDGVAAGSSYDVVLVDIQSCSDPAAAIGRLRAVASPQGAVIAFGPHVWKERLEAAVAAGADAAASRGEVLEGLATLLDRVAPR
jgi:DNA-binding NarL/FixJ family response regulator